MISKEEQSKCPSCQKSLPFLLGRWFRQRLEKLFVRQPWLEAELAKHTLFRHQMSWGYIDQKPNAISEKSSLLSSRQVPTIAPPVPEPGQHV